jgi:hypothetical protein
VGKKNRSFSNDQKDDECTKTQVDGRDKTPLRLSIFSLLHTLREGWKSTIRKRENPKETNAKT